MPNVRDQLAITLIFVYAFLINIRDIFKMMALELLIYLYNGFNDNREDAKRFN